uniref:Uncharacterized protein n=1 Tax=Ciona intestinalis TaxID=7719 RepID=H2Y1K7_CIOIN
MTSELLVKPPLPCPPLTDCNFVVIVRNLSVVAFLPGSRHSSNASYPRNIVVGGQGRLP